MTNDDKQSLFYGFLTNEIVAFSIWTELTLKSVNGLKRQYEIIETLFIKAEKQQLSFDFCKMRDIYDVRYRFVSKNTFSKIFLSSLKGFAALYKYFCDNFPAQNLAIELLAIQCCKF